MLLSREVLPDFAVLSFSMCCMSLVERFFLVSSIVWDQWGVTGAVSTASVSSPSLVTLAVERTLAI
jgi:hypothetical protein